jgi:hypothetical protein
LLFASQAGKHITGQILPVDGGVSAVIAAWPREIQVHIPLSDARLRAIRFARQAEIACSCARSPPTRGCRPRGAR